MLLLQATPGTASSGPATALQRRPPTLSPGAPKCVPGRTAMPPPPPPAPATALLTLWLDADGGWRASVVTADGERLEFRSPFELARWSRGRAGPRLPADGRGRGLR